VKVRFPKSAGWVACLLALVLSACATAPAPATKFDALLPFDQAAAEASKGLIQQATSKSSPTGDRRMIVDPMLDVDAGQQTAATQRLEKLVTDSLTTKDPGFELLPFHSASLSSARYLLTGTTSREGDKQGLRINLALIDLKSGKVLAQSSALAGAVGVDTTPTAYYRDSPISFRSSSTIAGYSRTTTTAPGQAADADYLKSLPADMQLSEANELYDLNRYKEALDHYDSTLAVPNGDQKRALVGAYLTHWRLRQPAEAEQAFSRLIMMSIAERSLNVKFLFNPGTTDFWSDPNFSGAYDMWLKQIARGIASSGYCVKVIGHTSHTGSQQFNDTLSLNRAAYITQHLQMQNSQLRGRLESEGRGFRENIVGIGTDDVRDALDRRVEFTIHDCR
jgi:outer membrane protein OmpA-like peptidoglycan-associated protein